MIEMCNETRLTGASSTSFLLPISIVPRIILRLEDMFSGWLADKLSIKLIKIIHGSKDLRMPILVKDFSWSETETQLSLTVPLRGVKASKVDIFSSNLYIKVNFPPYFFEAHLFAPVIEEQCTVRVGNGTVVFNLVKENPVLWGQLMSSEESREQMVVKREEAIEHGHRRYKEQLEEKAKKKREEEKFAIKEQMKLEQEEKDRIEKEKQVNEQSIEGYSHFIVTMLYL